MLDKRLVELILDTEEDSRRFEEFCCQLLSEISGRSVLPTSRSWDKGRDGRTADFNDALFTACSVGSQDPGIKFQKDLARLATYDGNFKAYLCTSQVRSEQAVDLHKRSLTLPPHCRGIEVLGRDQITELGVRHEQVFLRHYANDLDSLRQSLSAGASEADNKGLRIALTLHGTDAGAEARQRALQACLLISLPKGREATLATVVKSCTDNLSLPRLLNANSLRPALTDLIGLGLVKSRINNETGVALYSLTENGAAKSNEILAAGAERLNQGRLAIETEFWEHTDKERDASSFDLIWKKLEEAMSDMFLRHGIDIVESVALLIGGQAIAGAQDSLADSIESLARSIEASQDWGEGHRHDYADAIRQMFSDSKSPAFDWLVELCAAYVSVCAMGLDRDSQKAIEDQISRTPLLLDTDVTLTYLSEGEPGHDAVTDVLAAWRSKRLVSEDVALECAHHAWIAPNEYNAQRDAVEDLETDIHDSIGNVFVRGYRRLLERREAVKWWDYIRAFRGKSQTDWKPIVDILSEDGFEVVRNHGIDIAAAQRVAADLYRKKSFGRTLGSRDTKRLHDKADRDGRLIACLVKVRKSNGEKAVLVTSSSLLRHSCETLGLDGDRPASVSFGAVAYLVALLPGAEVNQKVIKRALFDVGVYARQKKCEQIVLGVLEASSPFRVHRKRRGFLKQEIRRKLFAIAHQRGQSKEEVEEEIRQSYEAGQAGDAIKALVTEVAREVVDPTAARTIDELSKRIQELEAEKALLKRAAEGKQ